MMGYFNVQKSDLCFVECRITPLCLFSRFGVLQQAASGLLAEPGLQEW